MANISCLLRHAALAGAKHGIEIYLPGSLETVCRISYQELYRICTRNGDAIRSMAGLRQDPVFLLHFESHLDGIIWFWSVVLAGYTPAFSPPFVHHLDQHRKHLEHLKRLLRDPIVLTTGKFAPYIRDHSEGLHIETIERVNKLIGEQDGSTADKASCTLSLGFARRPTDIAVLMLTSGSTGAAKAVCLRNEQIFEATRGKVAFHKTTAEDVFLNWIGMDHVANLTESHLHALYLNAKQVHVHATDLVSSPSTFLSLIDQHHVSFTFAPNFFLASLTRTLQDGSILLTADGKQPDLSCLKCVTSGGEALVVKTSLALLSFLERFGAPRNCLVPGFGMTECCAGSIHNTRFPEYDLRHALKFASLGTCHPDVEMRVVSNKDEGAHLKTAIGDVGQLHLRGQSVFSGYYNDPESNRAAFTDDGWFVTGDLALIDEEGMLRLAGREIDSVNINGVKHNIAELQTSLDLAGLPGVVPTYTVVFGHRPEDGDTEVVSVAYLASYELEDGKARYDATNAISMEIMLQCNARPYKIIPLDAQDLQKTSLGKLSASKVRRMFENGQFEEQEKLNKQLLFDYLASVAAKTATETNGSDEENLNPTERAIRQAVSEVMDIPPAHLGLDTGIMQMGVNSMQLIHFKKRIEELVAIADIPMITILTNPTIRELAAAVCGQPEMGTPEDPISEYNPVVIMNKTGSGAPLWLVHPGAGEILVYLNLAKYFVDERPVYAIRARGFDGEPFFRDTMECISTYFDAIKRVQPEGPYNILGYSFGSMFAFEIAKQLQTVGDSIAFLGVLNLPPHIKQRIRQLNMVTAVLTLSLFLGLVEDDDPETFSPNIASMTYDDVLDDILAHRAPPGRMIELALDRAKLLRWAEVSNALHEMAWDYEPSGMVNIVDVFVAHPLKAVASNREDWFEKQISRWVHFSRTLPRFHEAEGEHFSMIGAEHVESFQAKLKAAMKARGV